MNSLIRKMTLAIPTALALNGSVIAAGWVDVQGTNAVLEYPGNTNNAPVLYKGWGLAFTQKANTDNWVHSSIPMSGLQQANQIYVSYYKQYAGAALNQVDIYNGGTYIQSVTPPASSSVGWTSFIVNLGAYKTFSTGLGVSLHFVPAAGLNTSFAVGDVAAFAQ